MLDVKGDRGKIIIFVYLHTLQLYTRGFLGSDAL